MRIFGSISRLVSVLFRKDGQDITVRPNQATTYTAARDTQLPPGDADAELVGTSATQTLTNKTLTAPVISTISNTGTVTLPTVTDTLVGRATTDTLTNKTIDAEGTGNSISNIKNADIKAGAGIIESKLTLDYPTATLNTSIQGRLAITGGTMTGSLAMGSNKITGLGTPTAAGDAVTKAYADSIAAGFEPKESVRVATTANLAVTASGTGVGKTLTSTGTGQLFVDGVLAVNGDRILVKNQAAAPDNGIYSVTNCGATAEVTKFTFSQAGSFYDVVGDGKAIQLQGHYIWFNVGDGANSPQTDPALSGNGHEVELLSTDTSAQIATKFFLVLDPEGDFAAVNSVASEVDVTNTTLGVQTDATATGSAAAVSVTAQGTNVAYVLTRATDFDGSPAAEVNNGAYLLVTTGTENGGQCWYVISSDPLTVDTSDILFSQASAPSAYVDNSAIAVTDSGWSGAGPYTKAVTHSLGSSNIIVELYDDTTKETVYCDFVDRTDGNTVTLTRSEATVGADWVMVVRK